jgi:cytochrome b561
MNRQKPSVHYDRMTIGLHWIMLGLLIAMYACIELRVLYPKGSDPREALKAWHFTLGLVVMLMAGIRLANRVTAGSRPPIVPPLGRWQSALSTLMHRTLYALMIGMPLLGWLSLSLAGKPIPFFGFELPALVGPDKELAKELKELHEAIGQASYWLIGTHAGAALFHHFIQRDNTLVRMLPARLRAGTGAGATIRPDAAAAPRTSSLTAGRAGP